MRLGISALAAAVVLMVAGTASAVKPNKEFVSLNGSPPYDIVGLCEDELVGQDSGHIQFITHFDREGNLKFDSALPSITITVTNPATGLSFTDRDVGLDKFTPAPGGGGVVLSTGIHFKVKGPDGRVIFRRIGLQVFTLDANFNVVDIEFHGTFDPMEDLAPTLCAALGTTPAV